MKKITILLILCLNQAFAFAQTDSLVVTGIVMETDSLKALKDAHYVINNKFAGSVNLHAKFTLLLHANDTLHFSHVGYQPVTFVVPDSLTKQSYVFGIFMRKDTVNLPEVVIIPRISINKGMVEQKVEAQQKQMQNLHNNIALAKYQAAFSTPQAWDADMNQKHQIQQLKNDHMYAGQIPPSETLNYLAFIPLTYYLITGRLFPDPPPAFKMSDTEEMKLKLHYEEQIRIQRTLEKTIR